jgi:hypothetical protein
MVWGSALSEMPRGGTRPEDSVADPNGFCLARAAERNTAHGPGKFLRIFSGAGRGPHALENLVQNAIEFSPAWWQYNSGQSINVREERIRLISFVVWKTRPFE